MNACMVLVCLWIWAIPNTGMPRCLSVDGLYAMYWHAADCSWLVCVCRLRCTPVNGELLCSRVCLSSSLCRTSADFVTECLATVQPWPYLQGAQSKVKHFVVILHRVHHARQEIQCNVSTVLTQGVKKCQHSTLIEPATVIRRGRVFHFLCATLYLYNWTSVGWGCGNTWQAEQSIVRTIPSKK